VEVSQEGARRGRVRPDGSPPHSPLADRSAGARRAQLGRARAPRKEPLDFEAREKSVWEGHVTELDAVWKRFSCQNILSTKPLRLVLTPQKAKENCLLTPCFAPRVTGAVFAGLMHFMQLARYFFTVLLYFTFTALLNKSL